MRGRRTLLALAALPVGAYLALLLLVAALQQPPLLGWIGLGIVGVVGNALIVAAVVLFPRMRANLTTPPAPLARGVLVLADASCPPALLCEDVAARLHGRDLPVHVVAPVLPTPLHYLSGADAAESKEAAGRLEQTLAALRSRGFEATGALGGDDPVQALGDALATFPAREVVLVTPGEEHWLELDLERRVRELGADVDHVVVRGALAQL